MPYANQSTELDTIETIGSGRNAKTERSMFSLLTLQGVMVLTILCFMLSKQIQWILLQNIKASHLLMTLQTFYTQQEENTETAF